LGPALWVTDFTYVATWTGFVYVAFVIDAYARRIENAVTFVTFLSGLDGTRSSLTYSVSESRSGKFLMTCAPSFIRR
jgi:transposase InsO family protein